MTIDFFQPPAAERVGGLDLAIASLKNFLTRAGVAVRSDPPVEMIGELADEIVHFHGLWQWKFQRISARCRRRGIPYVVSPHGMLEPWAWRHKRWKKWPYFQLFERKHLTGASRLLSASDAEARNLEKFFPRSKCPVLPFGIADTHKPAYAAARQSLGWGESELVVLFLSRIHPKKGLPMLLEALVCVCGATGAVALQGKHVGLATGADALQGKDVGAATDAVALQGEDVGAATGAVGRATDAVALQGKAMRLVIVGGGAADYVREMKAFVNANERRLPRVDWIGEKWGDEKWPYLQGADLMCLPSYSENFGFSVLEALQVGTRVITTDQTPWESIPSWGAGWIVPPRAAAVAGALATWLANSGWTNEQRAQLAAETSQRYSWDKIGPEYLRMYEELAERAKR